MSDRSKVLIRAFEFVIYASRNILDRMVILDHGSTILSLDLSTLVYLGFSEGREVKDNQAVRLMLGSIVHID
jgi:hypothetical protein